MDTDNYSIQPVQQQMETLSMNDAGCLNNLCGYITRCCSMDSPSGVQPPRWRAYTSSSYYYTDYTFPKPQSKHKFVPGPQYCPDTGRTICKGVRNYPDEHIYQLVSSTKARRFNFTTVFVDERDGDVEPNNELLPEGPPKVQHDGYVVYQTAVHYDYHLPSASVPWRYAPAPAAATTINTQSIHRRRRPIIRRQLENDEKPVCPARTRFVPPQAALNDNSEWKYIVNVQNKDVRFRQIIRVDVCESPGQSCTREISLPFGYVSQCKQKFIKKKLLALDSDGQGTSVENFFIPSCCVCHVSRTTQRR
ncbi:protein spaetzle 5 [Caerostris extrusa]|uniref:Protein spaetzle 5 n=1 Tax=Caerostris extrusa TaxID=172846 RepID=A0AAV4MC79_CAEEX|nr:protein spaetzle 5 [Caerostris extrusa]